MFIDLSPNSIVTIEYGAVVSFEIHQQVPKGVAIVTENEVIQREVIHKSNQYSDSQLTQDPLISAYLNSTLYCFHLLQPMHLNRIFNWTAAAFWYIWWSLVQFWKVNLTFWALGYHISIYLCLISSAYHVSVKYRIFSWDSNVKTKAAFRENIFSISSFWFMQCLV